MKAKKYLSVVPILIFCICFITACSSGDTADTPLYSVVYNDNSSTGGAPPVDSTKYSQDQYALVLDNTGGLTRTGYYFIGWCTSKDSISPVSAGYYVKMPASDLTLYACWTTQMTYGVLYDGNGNDSGFVPIDYTRYLQTQKFDVKDNVNGLSRAHYAFNGWNTDKAEGGVQYSPGDKVSMGSSDQVLYATWRLAAPQKLNALPTASSTVLLSWADNSTGETGFEIDRAPDSSGSPGAWSAVAIATANAISYSDATALSGTVYWYRVRALASVANDNSSYTESVSAKCVLLGYWPLQSDLLDYSGNGLSGVWKGPPSVAPMSFAPESGKTGIHFRVSELEQDNAGNIDYVNGTAGDHLIVPHDSAISLLKDDYLTVAFWIFWDSSDYEYFDGVRSVTQDNRYMNIISHAVWYSNGWQIRQDNTSNKLELYVHHKSTITYPFDGADPVTLVDDVSGFRGRWVHVVVEIDNVNLKVTTYIDGAKTATSPVNLPCSFTVVPTSYTGDESNTGDLAIGAFSHSWGGFPVNGKMRSVYIYHGLLDASGVDMLYAND